MLVAAIVVATAACGYDTSATFSTDGSVTVGLKFLFPKSLMSGTNGASVSGFSPPDIASANAKLQAKYPGGKVSVVTEGDESGALFSLDRKTAIWKLSWLHAQTLTATTGPDAGGLVSSISPVQGDVRVAIAVGFIAIAVGFLLGMFLTWRGLLPLRQPATAVALSPAAPHPPSQVDAPSTAWPSPPSEEPPPTKL